MPIMISALKQQGLVRLTERVCERHGYKEEQVTVPKVQSKRTQVQGYLTDVDFLMISEMMDGDWKSVGRNLLIADVELIEIERKFPTQIVESALKTLVQWRNKQGSSVDQLKEIKRVLTKRENEHCRKTRGEIPIEIHYFTGITNRPLGPCYANLRESQRNDDTWLR